MHFQLPGGYHRPERIIPIVIGLSLVFYFMSAYGPEISPRTLYNDLQSTAYKQSTSDINIDIDIDTDTPTMGAADFLQVSLTSLKDEISGSDALDVEVTVKNVASNPVTVLNWNSPFDNRASMIGMFQARVVTAGEVESAKRSTTLAEKIAAIKEAKHHANSNNEIVKPDPLPGRPKHVPLDRYKHVEVEVEDQTPQETIGEMIKSPEIKMSRLLPPSSDDFVELAAEQEIKIHMNVPWPRLHAGSEYAISVRGNWVGVWAHPHKEMTAEELTQLSGGLTDVFESNEVRISKTAPPPTPPPQAEGQEPIQESVPEPEQADVPKEEEKPTS